MGEQRITASSRWDLGGWKKRKKEPEKVRADVVCLLLLSMCAVAGGAAGWEEGDDSVNVISLENLDALLRLRMVTELKSLDIFANISDEAQRSRRWVSLKPKLPPFGSQIAPLCSRIECDCLRVDAYLNVSCQFQPHEVVELGPGSLPSNLLELHLSNPKELRILPGSFSDHRYLVGTFISKAMAVTIKSQAFQNLSGSHFVLEIKDCQTLILEEHSFRNLKSPLSATIEDCEHVIMKKSVFSWLLDLQIKNVPNLEVVENTFSVEINKIPELSAATITFRNATVNKVPNATFPLSAAIIRFVDCTVESVGSGAFSAVSLSRVDFEGTKLGRLESGAFSDRTLISDMRFNGSTVNHIAPNALSAANNLTIQNSSIGEVTSGAFNVKTAAARISGNKFRKIRRRAFEIHAWNSVVIEENRFENLEPDSFVAPFPNDTGTNEFVFARNVLVGIEVDALSFVPSDAKPNKFSKVYGNKFEEQCHCHLESWTRKRSSSRWEGFYETSFCLVSDVLARCYNLEKGYMRMKNYTKDICGTLNNIVCEESSRSYHPDILTDLDLENTERTVLGVIFLGVVCSVSIMLAILSLMWLKQKGVCGRAGRSCTPSTFSFFGIFSRLFNSSSLVTTASISRMNIHEYAEIQNQINKQQKHTILDMEDEDVEEEELVACEDKATQTLPEELTQELLQSLREKLEDPENYNEARDMIEHLYDLIKVEESCNNNHASPRTSFMFEEEEEDTGGNIYDVIQPKKARAKRRNADVNVVSTGTRAPSPDKLQPVNYNMIRPTPTLVNHYTEPRDRKSHEYCELPGAMPDVLAFNRTPHVYAEPVGMVNRPLPKKPDQPGTSHA